MKEVTKFDYKTGSVSVEYYGTNPCKEIPIPTYQESEVHWSISPSASTSTTIGPITGTISPIYIRYSDLISWYDGYLSIPVKSDEDTGKEFWE